MATGRPKAIEPAALQDRSPGALLREARLAHGLSQKQLAIRGGTTQSAIARIERDGVSPSIKTMTGLLQVMEEDFVFGARPRNSGTDLSRIQANLELTPTERLERGLASAENQRRSAKGEK